MDYLKPPPINSGHIVVGGPSGQMNLIIGDGRSTSVNAKKQ